MPLNKTTKAPTGRARNATGRAGTDKRLGERLPDTPARRTACSAAPHRTRRSALRVLLPLLLASFGLASCYYKTSAPIDDWTATGGSLDTAAFVHRHHYGPNFNFNVTGDSLRLSLHRPGIDAPAIVPDSCTVRRGDKIVVADIALVPTDSTDSVWVKVARDQGTMGWIGESRLTPNVVPNDPISGFIHTFSSSRMRVAGLVAGLVVVFTLIQAVRRRHLRLVHFNDIDSFYPTLLCLTVSGAATLYGSVQHFIPETWVEFYYHPTLNPIGLPFILSVFVASVWLMVITALAAADDLRRRLDWADIPAYVAGLLGVCMVLYLFFSLTTPLYIGYPLLVAYWTFALARYFRRRTARYVCGRCGQPLDRLGRCPRCGALNT